jgi:sugar lactone lactonase YvrE
VAVGSPSALGESPFWHPREQRLYWCDIAGRAVYRSDAAGAEFTRWEFDCEPGSCAPLLDGGLIVALRDGLWRFDTATGQRTLLAAVPYDAAHERFNEGKCDPQGRFWVGTIYEPRHPPRAALYCYDQGLLQRKVQGLTTANGLAWSPDGRTMYWSDTPAHTIYACDFEPATGALSRHRVFVRFPSKEPGQDASSYGGRPDGAAVDAEGCYWVAMYEGQRLLRLAPTGECVYELRLPVRCPTMPCFGGPDLKTIYITTARANRPPAELAEQPWAGCVLSVRVDVPGLPVNAGR